MTDDRQHHLRRAEPREAKELEELQCRSASRWDYPDGYFDWAGDARKISESYIRDNTVLGRVLWQHAVQTARELGVSEFIIGADPNAAPFYKSMGARWYASNPTEEPTWTVQMYRFTLPR